MPTSGLDEITQPGETQNGRPWDTSNGFFGQLESVRRTVISPRQVMSAST